LQLKVAGKHAYQVGRDCSEHPTNVGTGFFDERQSNTGSSRDFLDGLGLFVADRDEIAGHGSTLGFAGWLAVSCTFQGGPSQLHRLLSRQFLQQLISRDLCRLVAVARRIGVIGLLVRRS
jgi:hypothetical protein